jgi:intein-encoded DNA endonuclease-like protein
MSHYSSFSRDRWKIELPSRDNSNFLSPNYQIIITIISKFDLNFLKNGMKAYTCP